MIKKYFKKLVSVALSAVMVMGMSVTAFASETDNTSVRGVYSPEFPDAYIITETNPLAILLIVQKYSLLL